MGNTAKKYIKAYIELGRVFHQAYRDSTVLDIVEKHIGENPGLFENPDINRITSMFVELVKKDLVLNICRIGAEHSEATNTVSLNMLYRLYKAGIREGVIGQIPELSELDEIVSPEEIRLAKSFRDKYIAHLDLNRNLDRLEIADLRKLLEKIQKGL